MAERTLDYTKWHCEGCGQGGTIQYVHGASVYEVLHILEDAHREASNGFCGTLTRMHVEPAESSTPSSEGRTRE